MSHGSVGRPLLRLLLGFLLGLLFVVVGLASPSMRGYADSPVRGPHSGLQVVAFGDSVPSGYACRCRPFPEIYGSLLGAATGQPVAVDNRAVNGLTTSGLLSQLGSKDVDDAAHAAQVVLVTIGANDFNDHHDQVVEDRCGRGGVECVRDELTSMRAHLTAVLARIYALRHGRPTTVLVTGYWNVFEDGRVALAAYGRSGLRASLLLTRRVNAQIRSVATAAGATYVDIYRPFESDGRNVTTLLASDGNHPDAAGHRLIARTLLRAGLPD
jgi:lysophospholipase L1-like esterase